MDIRKTYSERCVQTVTRTSTVLLILLVLVSIAVFSALPTTALGPVISISGGEGYLVITVDTGSYVAIEDSNGRIITMKYVSQYDEWNLSLPAGTYIVEGRPAGLSPIPYSSTSVKISVESGKYYHVHLSYSYSVLFISLITGIPTFLVSLITYFNVSGRRKKYLKRLRELVGKLEDLSDRVRELGISDVIERYNKLLDNARSLEKEKSMRTLSHEITSIEEEYESLEKTVEEYYKKLTEYQDLKKQVIEKIDKILTDINNLLRG